MSYGQVSHLESQRKRKEQDSKTNKLWRYSHREQIKKRNSMAQKKRTSKGSTTCKILKIHHEEMKDDPEHLTTEFLNKILGVNCK